jgi:hypothetical protein
VLRNCKSDLVHDFDSMSKTYEAIPIDGTTLSQDEDVVVETEHGILERGSCSGSTIPFPLEHARNLSPSDGSGTITEGKSWRLNGSPRLSNAKKRTNLCEYSRFTF